MRSADSSATPAAAQRVIPLRRAPGRRGEELAFLSAALEIMETPPSPIRRAIGATVILLFCATLAWAWWTQHLLLGGRVAWRPLFPGAVATAVALFGLNLAMVFYLSRSITSNTITSDVYAFIFDQKDLMAGAGIQGSKITRIDKYPERRTHDVVHTQSGRRRFDARSLRDPGACR